MGRVSSGWLALVYSRGDRLFFRQQHGFFSFARGSARAISFPSVDQPMGRSVGRSFFPHILFDAAGVPPRSPPAQPDSCGAVRLSSSRRQSIFQICSVVLDFDRTLLVFRTPWLCGVFLGALDIAVTAASLPTLEAGSTVECRCYVQRSGKSVGSMDSLRSFSERGGSSWLIHRA